MSQSLQSLAVEVLRITLGWPICFLSVMLIYRKAITTLIASLPSLLPGGKIKLTIVGVSFEIPVPALEQSITESLGGKKLTTSQKSLLTMLSDSDEGRSPLEPSHEYVKLVARPLRNSGLIKSEEPLEDGAKFAKEIEITTLGRYVAKAENKSS